MGLVDEFLDVGSLFECLRRKLQFKGLVDEIYKFRNHRSLCCFAYIAFRYVD